MDVQCTYVSCAGAIMKLRSLIERLVEIKNIISLFAASGTRGGPQEAFIYTRFNN